MGNTAKYSSHKWHDRHILQETCHMHYLRSKRTQNVIGKVVFFSRISEWACNTTYSVNSVLNIELFIGICRICFVLQPAGSNSQEDCRPYAGRNSSCEFVIQSQGFIFVLCEIQTWSHLLYCPNNAQFRCQSQTVNGCYAIYWCLNKVPDRTQNQTSIMSLNASL